MNHSYCLLLLTGALLTGGCVAETSRVESHYGQSIRLMVELQTADKEAAEKPITAQSLDGTHGQNIVDNYRSDIAKPQQVNNDIVFNIGK